MAPPDTLTTHTASPRADSTHGVARIDSIAVFSNSQSNIIPSVPSAAPNFFFTEYTKALPLKPRVLRADSWIAPLLLLLVFVLAILFTSYAKELLGLVLSPFRKGGIRKINAEENFMARRTLYAMLLVFLFALPVFIYQTLLYTGFHVRLIPGMPMYPQLAGLCVGLIGLKLLLIRFTGSLFMYKAEANSYVHGFILVVSLAAVILIPASLTGLYLPAQTFELVLGGTWFVVALTYLGGIITGMNTALKGLNISKFHIFLYFCTFEIFPALLMFKVIRNMD
ncbi:MAG: DUF4271 domain-containing protein [Bacteroidia bacterium]|jgi:hypothetical protein|nr:DUF4271 domain-containing protein [Bacteroidia bacterium]MCC6768699.1 DUF4271 domain-containing protein [Bacteroidia bacterium]